MSDLLTELRDSRKSHLVLKHKLISIRSVRPDIIVFVFEGIEDVGVYETWIERLQQKPIYESLPGKGKEQLLGLHEHLSSEDPDLLQHVYFFVDHDFDAPVECDEHLFVLNAYSVENFLCCREAIDSILSDEFQCAGSPKERERVLDKFEEILDEFKRITYEINFFLFVARRRRIKVLKKPEDIRSIADIQVDSVRKSFETTTDVLVLEHFNDGLSSEELKTAFEALPDIRRQRGKYLLLATRKWLEATAADRRQQTPALFESSLPNLPGQPWLLPLRRFASRSQLPSHFEQFIGRACEASR